MSTELQTQLQTELEIAVEHRRNFAIISHPDAGKTTLKPHAQPKIRPFWV